MTWTWELYRDENDEISTELLEYFWLLLSEEQKAKYTSKQLECLLTREESVALKKRIEKLGAFYPRSLSDGQIDHFVKNNFYELRLIRGDSSFRFFFVQKHPQTFVFVDAIVKKYSGSTRKGDRKRAGERAKQVHAMASTDRKERRVEEGKAARAEQKNSRAESRKRKEK